MHVVLLKSRAANHGGLEKAASRIATAFVERGEEVSILTTGAPPTHPFIHFHSTYPSSWPAFLRMEQFDRFTRHWLQKNKADLVFGMDRNRYQTHIRAGNGVHAAYLKSRIFTEGRLKYLTCLCNPLHQKILQLEKEAFEYPGLRKLFTNSQMVKDQILDRFSTDPAKIQVIHNGVEWREMEHDFATWSEAKPRHCQALGLDPHFFQLLFIGNGYLRKGLDRLLEGLAHLSRKDIQLSIIGKDNHQGVYEAKAEQLGLSKQVRFFGSRSDIRSFYQVVDALAIPSFYDPFANVTVEALAMGLFVISSKQNGGSEILTPDNGTIIEDLLSREAMALALEQAISRPKTDERATHIRQSVEHLDFSYQLNTLLEACYV
ncbi:MAG: glycosyltransferase [Verrucomicrobiota bacterium]|nr:glycosyltransferase [Verrucomicrobiota bacterium]